MLYYKCLVHRVGSVEFITRHDYVKDVLFVNVDPPVYREHLVHPDHRDLKDLEEKREQMDHGVKQDL